MPYRKGFPTQKEIKSSLKVAIRNPIKTMTYVTCKRKHYTFRTLEPMTIAAGSMAARRCWSNLIPGIYKNVGPSIKCCRSTREAKTGGSLEIAGQPDQANQQASYQREIPTLKRKKTRQMVSEWKRHMRISFVLYTNSQHTYKHHIPEPEA